MTTTAKAGNREKLLRGAMQCLREKGYAHTTARDLVAASDTNLASIGYHFGSKEALLNEAVAEGSRRWMQAVEAEAFAGEPVPARERLRRTLVVIVDRFDELEPLLFAFVEAFPPAVRTPELRESMARAYEDVRTAGAAAFERMVEGDGTISGHDARVLAGIVLAMGDGLILQWLLDPDSTPSSEEIITALGALERALTPPPDR